MTKDKTVTMSRELIREQFEYSVSDRAWFVASGMVEDDTPEGFVYGDFTTDMCWTCYFEARQIAAPVVERQPVAWLDEESGALATDKLKPLVEGFDIPLFASPPEPVAADIAHDRAYRNGMMAGFQFGITGNEKGYALAIANLNSELHAAKGESTAPVAVDERAEFEKFVRREWVGAPVGYSVKANRYRDDVVQRAWVGWQARACLDKLKELNQ